MAGNPEYESMLARLIGSEAFLHDGDGKIHCGEMAENNRV